MEKKIIFTTSWDDGSREDFKVLELLDKYNLKGTFYVPQKIDFPLIHRVSDNDLLAIAQKQEIGAHTINHFYLDSLSLDEARKEIVNSKKYLEDLLGRPIKMFCYPGGRVNQEIAGLVREAGFIGARTTNNFQFKITNPFLMNVSLHCYPFPFRPHWRSFLQPLQHNLFKIKKLNLPLTAYVGWLYLAKHLFDYAQKNGGIFHLWGHSWEIEKHRQWVALEQFFKYAAGRVNVRYYNNSQVLETLDENINSH